jgi:hypothetical protein
MPDIHDYYPLIARAVAGFGGGTPDIRKDLYERARASQAKNINPASFPPAIAQEREALELAIHAVEVEAVASDAERAENTWSLRRMACFTSTPGAAAIITTPRHRPGFFFAA